MSLTYKQLFESIRKKCEQEHWFGPELLSPVNRICVPANDPNRFGFVFPQGEWLQSLLPICDLGCVLEACVDAQQRMFIVAPLDSDDYYWLYQLPWNFEEWLWRWVKGEELMVNTLN